MPRGLSETVFREKSDYLMNSKIKDFKLKDDSHHRIKTVVHIITGLGDGGAEAALYRMVIYNTDEKSTVISLSNKSKYGKLLEEKGVTVHALELSFNFNIFLKLYKLYKLLKKIQPDVIQTWMYHADLVGGVSSN